MPYGLLTCDAGGLQRWRIDLLHDEEAKAFRGEESVENAGDERSQWIVTGETVEEILSISLSQDVVAVLDEERRPAWQT